MKASKWKHDDLMRDLATHLAAGGTGLGCKRRMVWTDLRTGTVHSPRPDVFTLERSFTQPKPVSYEIKVTRSDFNSDVTAGKWMKYKPFSAGVIFAVPHGLVKKTEIPDGCGLMVRSDRGWSTARKPTLQDVVPGFELMQKLLMDGIATEHRQQRSRRVFDQYAAEDKVRREFGDDVADALRSVQGLRSKLDRLRADVADAEGRIAEIQADADATAQRALQRDRGRLDEQIAMIRKRFGWGDDVTDPRVISRFGRLLWEIDRERDPARQLLTNLREYFERQAKHLEPLVAEPQEGTSEAEPHKTGGLRR